MTARLWLVVYDVGDDHVRRALEKQLLEVGQRVQESKFECQLDSTGISRLWEALCAQIDVGRDTLHAFPLCASCSPKVCVLGAGEYEAATGLWIL